MHSVLSFLNFGMYKYIQVYCMFSCRYFGTYFVIIEVDRWQSTEVSSTEGYILIERGSL